MKNFVVTKFREDCWPSVDYFEASSVETLIAALEGTGYKLPVDAEGNKAEFVEKGGDWVADVDTLAPLDDLYEVRIHELSLKPIKGFEVVLLAY